MSSEAGKIPTLDKGYVQLRCFAPSNSDIKSISRAMKGGDVTNAILNMAFIHLNIKCPYFLLIPLVSSDIKAVWFPSSSSDAYIPDQTVINSGSVETDIQISESMKMTVDTMIINQKGYVKDGCNSYVASCITPVSTYWEGIMYGKLIDWLRFCNIKGLHPIAKAYQESTIAALSVEYTDVKDMMRMVR